MSEIQYCHVQLYTVRMAQTDRTAEGWAGAVTWEIGHGDLRTKHPLNVKNPWQNQRISSIRKPRTRKLYNMFEVTEHIFDFR